MNKVSGEEKIQRDELRELFGDRLPIEAVNLIWNCEPGKTVAEARAELRALAARLNAGHHSLTARLTATADRMSADTRTVVAHVTLGLDDIQTIISALRSADLGMAWWNHLTEQERAVWLQRAGSAVSADAWAEFQRGMAASEDAITAAARYIAETVMRTSWEGLGRHDGTRARDDGFDPWTYANARPEDYRDVARAVLALISHPQADAWRPIEMAPKDGSRFLAFQPGRDYQTFECWWQDDFSNWSGWQNERDNEPEPTHWQPLPHPPLDRSGQ